MSLGTCVFQCFTQKGKTLFGHRCLSFSLMTSWRSHSVVTFAFGSECLSELLYQWVSYKKRTTTPLIGGDIQAGNDGESWKENSWCRWRNGRKPMLCFFSVYFRSRLVSQVFTLFIYLLEWIWSLLKNIWYQTNLKVDVLGQGMVLARPLAHSTPFLSPSFSRNIPLCKGDLFLFAYVRLWCGSQNHCPRFP